MLWAWIFNGDIIRRGVLESGDLTNTVFNNHDCIQGKNVGWPHQEEANSDL